MDMLMTRITFAAGQIVLALTLASAAAGAHEYRIKEMRIDSPFATPTVAAQANGAVYFTLENKGRQPMRLIRAASPVATRVEVHHMAMDGGVARMREVGAISVKGGETIKMAPAAGYHLMLIGLKSPLKEGDKFPLTIEFESAGSIEISVVVQKPKAAAAEHKH
jgi:periplasmic copper chaperone A